MPRLTAASWLSSAMRMRKDGLWRRVSPRGGGVVPAGLGVLGGVVEKIGEGLRQPRQIRIKRDRLSGECHQELVFAGIDQRPARFNRHAHNLGQLDALAAKLELVARDAR